jgi:hypothetical protein
MYLSDGTEAGTMRIPAPSATDYINCDCYDNPVMSTSIGVFFTYYDSTVGYELGFIADQLPVGGGGGGGWTSYTLSVTTPRFGTITSDDGFACAPTDVSCARVAREGRTVTFSSSVLPGHTFVRWNGCTSGSAGTCSVTLNSETTISASYGSRWLARFVGTSTTLRASSAATVSAAATDLSSLGTGDTITITGYAKTAGAKALERAKVLRRALRAAGVTAPITITTAASSATPAKRAKAAITVVWGVTP